MPTQLLLTRLLNHSFAGAATWLLHLVHVTPVSARAPITNTVAMELLAFVVLLIYFVIVRLSLTVEKPKGVQHLAEIINEFVVDQSEQIIGDGYRRFTSYLTVLGLFILVCNLMGLIPGLESPTANVVAPLGFAIVTFIYYHLHGIRANRASYIKQFLGPVWWISWLLFPIEIISHVARVLSLTVRLYANIFAGDLLILAFFSIIPIGIPVVFIGLHFGVDIIQAYVFFLLASIYLSMAVAHEH
ncbi:MAG TPA: F0F1 ATP synthase subunit A [Acidobacteriaceae bacterium]|nr:F0F1 ATP synthase subunit A [Acidobacteriaceae bacterium]